MKVAGPGFASAMISMSMMEKMHQRAGGEQEIGKNPEKVSAVLGPEKKGSDQQKHG
jgi:hypothetical protein